MSRIRRAGNEQATRRTTQPRRSTAELEAARQSAKAEAAPIHEGSPQQVARMLADMEAAGRLLRESVRWDGLSDIAPGDVDCDDTAEEGEETEIDWGDEDDLADTSDERATGFDSPGADFSDVNDEVSPFVDDACEIRVFLRPGRGWCCRMADDGWEGGRAREGDQQAKSMLHEVGIQKAVRRGVAAWLEKHRQMFLSSRRLWDLGCCAETELENETIPIFQNGLLHMDEFQACLAPLLAMPSTVPSASLHPGTFSRHIRSVQLVWDDGWVSLEHLLFGRDTRLAWAANAIARKLTDIRPPLPIEWFRKFRDPRSLPSKERLSEIRNWNAANPIHWVAKICRMAKVSFKDVVETQLDDIRETIRKA